MSCELPIVSTNCPSGPNEIFESNIEYDYGNLVITKYGILVPRNNEFLMAKAIDKMTSDLSYYTICKNAVKIRVKDFRKEKLLTLFFNQIFFD
jgi:N-acetylgalactosamine-N,N'-diacetylbacillosaminyl-diphospho-undecaprenol 4-alpha-N-acetylgalactosaminyltransferase